MADHSADDVNITDQDSMTAEEQALLSQMEKDGDGDGDEGAAQQQPQQRQATKKAPKVAKQPVQVASEGDDSGEGDGEGEDGAGQGEGNQDGKGSRMVPHQALHEAREELKSQRVAMTQMQESHKAEMAKAMDRFERALASFAPKPEEPKPEPVPDYDTDPAGWIAHTMKTQGKTIDQVQGELKTLREEKAKREETDKQTSVVRGILNYAITKETEFKAANPDYDEASAFLLQSRRDDLAEMGYGENEIVQMIQGEKLAIAAQAQQAGKNPAEIVYNTAKRHGYQKKAAAGGDGGAADGVKQQDGGAADGVKQQDGGAADGVKQQDGGAADGVKQQDGKEKLETVRQGTEQGRGLSGARGNSPSPMTAQRLLEMSEAEFDRAMMTSEGRALMGQ